MELFIRLKDGAPFEHPIFGDNFRQAFPHVDVNNLPAWAARFERIPQPDIGLYEVNDGVTYEWGEGVVRDVWHVRPMTGEEKAAKRNALSDAAIALAESFKDVAKQGIAAAQDDATKAAWQAYAKALGDWVLVDPEKPNIPQPPIVREDGTVLSVNVSGSHPNVIG